MAQLALEQEKKNLQFSKIDMAFAHSRPDSYREIEDVELSLLPPARQAAEKDFSLNLIEFRKEAQ